MHPYPDALHAMDSLLGALGEQHWRNWIAHDIAEWEDRKSVQHHLSAYGGMGSFNDITFEDPWLDTLFEDLKSACYYFAHHPTDKPDTKALEHSMGTMRVELSGWRCLACGHGVVSHSNIDRFIAARVIRRGILAEAAKTHLREFVAATIRSRPSDAALTTENFIEWLKASGLHARSSNEWLRPCPSCGSDDTAVYRWLLVDEGGKRFVPSHDNLPLRSEPAGRRTSWLKRLGQS